MFYVQLIFCTFNRRIKEKIKAEIVQHNNRWSYGTDTSEANGLLLLRLTLLHGGTANGLKRYDISHCVAADCETQSLVVGVSRPCNI